MCILEVGEILKGRVDVVTFLKGEIIRKHIRDCNGMW